MAGQRYCEQCGAPLAPGVRFCTKCGAPVGGASGVGASSADASADGAADRAVPQPFESPAPTPEPAQPAPRRRSAVPVIACVVALVLVAGAGAFALTDGFTNLPWSGGSKSQITRVDAGSAEQETAEDEKPATKSRESKSSSATTTPQKSAEELDRDAAVTFAKTFWTNAEPSGEDGADCTTIDDWTDRNLALVDPSCALYGEIQSKGMDILQAEDSCVSADVTPQQGSTVTVTVGVAGYRENPSAGWEKTANFTYRMDIQLNDSDQVTGFTSYYTDPSTGKTYSQSH